MGVALDLDFLSVADDIISAEDVNFLSAVENVDSASDGAGVLLAGGEDESVTIDTQLPLTDVHGEPSLGVDVAHHDGNTVTEEAVSRKAVPWDPLHAALIATDSLVKR